MKIGPAEVQGLHLLLRNFDSCWIRALIQHGLNRQTRGSRGIPNQLDDDLMVG